MAIPKRVLNSALSEHAFVLKRKFCYIIVDVCQPCCKLDVLVRASVGCEGDIVLDCIGEKEIILRNVCGCGADALYRDTVYVLSVDKESSVGDVVGTENEVDHGGLA